MKITTELNRNTATPEDPLFVKGDLVISEKDRVVLVTEDQRSGTNTVQGVCLRNGGTGIFRTGEHDIAWSAGHFTRLPAGASLTLTVEES